MSPAASWIMSPGTSSASGISRAFAVADHRGGNPNHGLELGGCRVGAGLLDESKETPSTTIMTINPPETWSDSVWAVANEIVARTDSSITRGFRHALMNS